MTEIAQWVQIVASVALCVLTWFLARATKVLAVESSASREDASRPKVLTKVKPDPDCGDFIQLVVQNVGRGPALDLEFRLKGHEVDFELHEVTPLRGTTAPIKFLAPGEAEVYSLGANHNLFQDPPLQFLVEMKYKDLDGNQHEGYVALDMRQFKELAWLGKSVEWRKMEALEKIAGKQVSRAESGTGI